MMLQPPCLVFFITLWFSLELACKASITTPEGNFFPLPTNVKILLYPGLIHVTWDCNITKSMAEHTYRIKYDGGKEENLNISKCFHEYFVSDDLEYVIHKGLEINISSSNESKIEKTIPEGKNNTAAENLRFEVYNVSIVNCSWTVGREAPKDTQYTLAFRETLNKSQQNRLYVQCEDYRTDSFGRQVGCILKAPKISFNMSIYVQLVGSSNETSIQLFDDIITLNNFVILDPPRNIRMNFSSSELEITWETPETYNSGNNCFQYNVKINGDIKDFTSRLQSYKTSNLNLKEKVNVSVRARWEDYCSKNMNWSRWSDPHIKEPESPNFTPNHLLLVLGIITFAVLLLLIFLCHRFQIWKRLFPQIPEPAKKIFESIEQKEILFQEPIITKKSLPEEDEECICLQITEIPKNEQPQYVNVNVNTGIHQAYSNIY